MKEQVKGCWLTGPGPWAIIPGCLYPPEYFSDRHDAYQRALAISKTIGLSVPVAERIPDRFQVVTLNGNKVSLFPFSIMYRVGAKNDYR